MVNLAGVIKFILCYALCLFYTATISFGLVVAFLLKGKSKIWVVKKRLIPPQCLQDKAYGEHKYITVNGIKLHYVEKGDSSKPLMLFVHGFPEFWYSWRYQIKEFSKDYWCVAIDQRGYGDSDKPKKQSDYHIDCMVEDIRHLINELGRKKFYLVAHDWGGVIAWRYVKKYSETLEKYIIMDAPSSNVWKKLIASSIKQFRMSWYIFFFQMPYLPELTTRTYDLKIFESMKRNNVTDEDVEVYKHVFGKKDALTAPINYYRANTKFLFPDAPLKQQTYFVPGLYLQGENDLFISPETGPHLQKEFQKLECEFVKGGSHFVQQDAPEETNRIMRKFLAKK